MKNKLLAIAIISAITVFNLSLVTDAQAAVVRLEVPKPVMDLWKKIHTEKVKAQEANTLSSEPASQPTTQPISVSPTDIQPMTTQPALIQPTINPETTKENFFTPPPKPPMDNFSEQKFPEKTEPGQPPKMDFNQPPKENNQFFGNQNQNNGQPGMMPNNKDQERAMRDFKRGAKQMEDMVKRFEKQMAQAEKNGGMVSDDMKNKLAQAKQLLEKIKNSKNTDDMGDDTMEQLQEIMNDLQQNGQEVLEKIQRLAGIKKELRNMERGVSMFEKQIAKLTKQGVAIPTNINENVLQLKKLIDTVKNAKSWDEVESAGLENMWDLMQGLDESRGQLEMLARWPQTQKQIGRELSNFSRVLSRDKVLVDKLNKQGVDLSENYQKLADNIASLKSTRDQAVEKMKAGESQEAFDLLENDFFNKMDDLREEQRIFDTLSNLGRFNAEFKKEMALAKRNIDRLAKNGEDTTELKDLLAQTNEKGNELLAILKTKPVDIEAAADILEELGDIRQSFQNNIQELSGEEQMPWEQGPKQFQDLKVSPGFNKFITPSTKPASIEQ
jgi:ABC-type transporter Mla subunit MlaD